MSWPLLFDLFLCLLLVCIALGAVLVRDLFAAVSFFIAFGLFIAIAWVRLGAVDVALAEAALGAGLTGVLLVRAAAQLRPVASDHAAGAGPGRHLLAALLSLALFAALARAVLGAPVAEGLAPRVDALIPATGVSNPVTSVLLNFRGYDTLLETVVLLAAAIGVWSLCTDSAWGGRAGAPDHARSQGLLASFARVLLPLGVLVGVHLLWAGADAPGGAFQAATVLATVWLLAVMAAVVPRPVVSDRRLRVLLVIGPGVFLLVAAAAIPFDAFLVFPPAVAKALVLLVEVTLTASLAAVLGLLVLGPTQDAR